MRFALKVFFILKGGVWISRSVGEAETLLCLAGEVCRVAGLFLRMV